MTTTKSWRKNWRIGRVQFGWHVHKHTYYQGDHRLVIHPTFIIDYGRRRDRPKRFTNDT